MENKTNNINLQKRKILSMICLIVFSLAFIFACLKSVLPIGKWIVCTFGIMTYPLFLILSLIELAKFLGLKYKRNKKSTVYFILILVSLLFVIQAISTYKQLDKVVSFASLKTYLKFSYTDKITLVGSFGSIFVGLFAMLLGAMGAIVAFVILFTISVGLIVDYENYGKFDENIKKLSTKKQREKVNNSDKDAKNGMPSYGYNKYSDELGTIEATEEDINYSQTEYKEAPVYSPDDIVDEYEEPVNGNDYPESEESYNNPFKTYDNETLTKSRQEFISGTFGNFGQNTNEVKQTEYELDEQPNNYSNFGTDLTGFETVEIPKTPKGSNDLWGNGESPDDIKIADNVKDILTKEEDDVENLIPDDITPFEPVFNEPKDDILNIKPVSPEPFGENINPPVSNPYENNIDNIEDRNKGILTGIPTSPKVEKVEKPVVPNGKQTSMIGVRYNPPPLSLLARPVKDTGNYSEEQARKSKQLEDVLESFNVPAKVVNIVRGPKITRYELSVPYGVSVKKIPNYEQDIQRALAAKSVTIQAPIPGSSYVGIELENDTFTSVFERELLESPEFQNAKGPLPIAIGKDISGQIIVKSLAKMVHVLIAGSTGSGKSVFIHNLVLSLIYKYGPEDLRLVMIDPKQVEFGFYNGLPHLVAPKVVLGTEKAVSALKWCVKEMDRRFEIMGRANYKNIEDYNKSELVKSGQFEHFPYIVIIVDELAEIMINYKKEADPAIQRITQLARACGMHLVLAVQRPSVNIITGVIKNNVPSRFAFRLQSSFDSKTMLDTVGAEKLLNQGDMLMQLTDTSAMPRLQGAYASDDEIKAVVDFVKRNNVAVFDEETEKAFTSDPQVSGDAGSGDQFVDSAPANNRVDEYFKIAVKSVMLNGSASVSYLQRRLSIGYSRAARIVDQMEEKGYIAPATGAKQRQILITPDKFKEIFGEDYNS